jgi:hypothetical protein
MEKIQLALQILFLVGIGGLVLLLRKYLPTYLTKKAENLATKEDIGEITHRVEEIRTQHLAALERVKSGLSDESAALLRRRQIYEETVKALRIFVAGMNATDAQKQAFLEHYQTLWLWAPDGVIRALNQFLDINKRFAANPDATHDVHQQRAFAEVILAMRRDIGFPESELQTAEYQFVSFVESGTLWNKLMSDRTG